MRPTLAGVAAVVLAAGASSRMGRSKPLLPIGSSTYLETILATLRTAGVTRCLVVLGSRAGRVRRTVDLGDAEAIHHRRWRRGMLSSLQAALRRLLPDAEMRAALVVPVDIPRFAAATVVRLAREVREDPPPVVLPSHQGRHGHPVLFARAVWADLLRAPADRGARAVVERHRAHVVAIEVDDPWILRDADTPQEHARLVSEPGG